MAEAPDWAAFALCPALLFAAGLLFFFLGGRKAYPSVALLLGGAGTFLVSCKGDPLPWAALYALEAALLRLLLFLPFARRREGDLYGKFRLPLEEPPIPAEEAPSADDLSLTHAFSLLEELVRCDLSAADRLEAEQLSRTLEGYRGKRLSEEERRTVNDCLSAVLKFTAKYRL